MCLLLSRGTVLLIQQNLTPCAGQGINPLLTDGADTHTTPALLPRPLSVVGVVAAVAPVTPEATHVRAVLVEVRLPRGLRPRPARDMRVHRLWHDDLEPAQHVARVRLEDRHADAAHHSRLRPRDPCPRVLPAVLTVVQVCDSLRGAVDEPLEAVVDLAEVSTFF